MSTYKWDATDYEKNSQAQQKWARELIAKLKLSGVEDVLDLGCGDGKVTAEIAKSLSNGLVVGVDNSVQMIELASKRYPSYQYKNLSFEIMDACNLSFDSRFDVVFSNAALHWVKNHKPVVDGLYKSLRYGGKILLQMGGEGNAKTILSVLDEVQNDPKWRSYFEDFSFPYGFFGVDEYKTLLNEAGFRIKRVELIPKDMKHEREAGLQGWIRITWLPYTQRIPEEKRDKFISAISSKYLKIKPEDSDGIVHVSMIRIEVEAEKIAKGGTCGVDIKLY